METTTRPQHVRYWRDLKKNGNTLHYTHSEALFNYFTDQPCGVKTTIQQSNILKVMQLRDIVVYLNPS